MQVVKGNPPKNPDDIFERARQAGAQDGSAMPLVRMLPPRPYLPYVALHLFVSLLNHGGRH